MKSSTVRRGVFASILGAAIAGLVAPLAIAGPAAAADPAPEYNPNLPGPRVVITTDGEGDDQASLHRALLYADQLDIEVIASSSSRWHWAGDPNATPPIPPNRWSGDDGGHDWIPELIDEGYRAVYPNLVAHDPDFPEPDELLSTVTVGNITNVGEMTKDTPGSLAIKSVLLDDDPRPVSLQAWGGTNTIAAALRSIKDEFGQSPEWASIQQRVYDKAELYIIQDQDVTYKQYIAIEWPGLKTVMNRDQFEAFAYSWAAQNPEPLIRYFQRDWVAANLKSGPFMESYPLNASTGNWFSEGDSPAFLHTIPTGLGQFENPTFGGWGGRFEQVSDNVWADDPRYLGVDADAAHDCQDAYPLIRLTLAAPATAGSEQVTLSNRRVGGGVHGQAQIFVGDTVKIGSGGAVETRTIVATQLTTRPYTVTLDQPVTQNYAVGASFVGYCSTFWPQARFAEAIQLDFAARAAWTVTSDYDDANHAPVAAVTDGVSVSAEAGQSVSLNGTATDPDGDALSYSWWQYAESGTYKKAVSIAGADSANATLTVPADAPVGSTIHVILEVEDDGAPAMRHYQRVIVTVTADKTRPEVSLVSPSTAGPFQALNVKVGAADAAGLQRIVANIYKGATLVKSTQTAQNGALTGTHEATVNLPSGQYTVKYNSQDLAGNISKTSTFAFSIDVDAPTATVKEGSSFTVGSNDAYDLVSFKLYDAQNVDKVTLNGVVKDLSNNQWSDVNFVKPGVFGAVRGVNTLVVYDVAGNQSTYTFTLN